MEKYSQALHPNEGTAKLRPPEFQNCNGPVTLVYLLVSYFLKSSVYSDYPMPVPPWSVDCTFKSQVFELRGSVLKNLCLRNRI